MSTSETEPVLAPVEDETEPVEEETDEPEAEDEPTEDEEPEAQALVGPPLSDKEEKKQEKALEAEAQRHASRISAILGEGAIELIPCEACHKNTPGWHYPAKAFEPGSLEYALYSMLAGGSGAAHRHPDYFQTCTECNGWGNVLTGAQMGLITYEIACPVCKTQGYIDKRGQQGAPEMATAPVNGTVATPPVDPTTSADMWGRPLGHPWHGKFPIYLTPDERAADLAAGYNIG